MHKKPVANKLLYHITLIDNITSLLSGIAVYDQARKNEIEKALEKNQFKISVGVRRNFYF